mgnify:CR=1 FL=1
MDGCFLRISMEMIHFIAWFLCIFCYALRSPLEWITPLDYFRHEANISPDEISKKT